jgi:hypothetical protein
VPELRLVAVSRVVETTPLEGLNPWDNATGIYPRRHKEMLPQWRVFQNSSRWRVVEPRVEFQWLSCTAHV